MAKKKKLRRVQENYSSSWEYIKESKKYIYSSIAVFLVAALTGFFIPAPTQINQLIMGFIEDLLLKTQGMNFLEITSFILLNNLQSGLLGIAYGIILGIFPVIMAFANGYLIGFVASESVSVGGIFILWRIVPHGIFELPALFISLGLGIKLGTFIFKKDKLKTLKEYAWSSLKVFVLIIVPLLLVAAIIEGILISFVG
jgi:stage II sporulation protein M